MTINPQCLICFLDDDFQSDIRLAAQQLSSRHEHALRIYGERFWSILESVGSVGSCPYHNQDNEHFTWWVDKWREAILASQCTQIIPSLIEAYEKWICGRLGEAFMKLDSLMTHFGCNKSRVNQLEKTLLFRGRKGRFIREDLYHIPFSKRHCISSQRYSIPGQPLLYLGLSILDIAYELGADPLDIQEYSFCYYWLRDSTESRILDLSNRPYHSPLE